MGENLGDLQNLHHLSDPVSFRHLPVTSLADIQHNFEQLPDLPHVTVTDLADVTRNFEALGISSDRPVDSLDAATKNFEALEAKGVLNG